MNAKTAKVNYPTTKVTGFPCDKHYEISNNGGLQS